MGPFKFVVEKESKSKMLLFFFLTVESFWLFRGGRQLLYFTSFLTKKKKNSFSWRSSGIFIINIITFLFHFEWCFNISRHAGSSWFTRPQRVSRYCRSACKYNHASLCLSLPSVLSHWDSSLIPDVCRDFLELTGRLVPKETWWEFFFHFFSWLHEI